mmetsp:Transcript_77992/g.223502  ORF Transcript_77992/g.223502 Transcript_77992/m.223502 type:complete len:203 (-) Transcript_77992:3532-4140(-)
MISHGPSTCEQFVQPVQSHHECSGIAVTGAVRDHSSPIYYQETRHKGEGLTGGLCGFGLDQKQLRGDLQDVEGSLVTESVQKVGVRLQLVVKDVESCKKVRPWQRRSGHSVVDEDCLAGGPDLQVGVVPLEHSKRLEARREDIRAAAILFGPDDFVRQRRVDEVHLALVLEGDPVLLCCIRCATLQMPANAVYFPVHGHLAG